MTIGAILKRTLKPAAAPPLKWKLPQVRPIGEAPRYDWASITDNFVWKWLNDPKRKAEHASSGIFHPSAGLHPDIGTCKRTLVFELIFAPVSRASIPSQLAGPLQNGTDRHEGLHKLFERMAAESYMGITKAERELSCIHPYLPISGHADMRLTMKDGWQYLFDYKTMSSSNCAKTYEPTFKHRVQLTTYMGILGVTNGQMIYENKDNQKWLGPMDRFRVDFDPNLYAEIEGFCTDILSLVKDETLPAFDKKECDSCIKFCWYQDICTQERRGKVDWIDYDLRAESVKKRHLEVFNG